MMDELIGLLGKYKFTLTRKSNYGTLTLHWRGKIFAGKDALEVLEKVEKWRDKNNK
jgi:hypothetical protein